MRDEAGISKAEIDQSPNCYLNVEYLQIYYTLLISIHKNQCPFSLEPFIMGKLPARGHWGLGKAQTQEPQKIIIAK